MSSTADDHYPAVVRWLRHLLSVDIFRMSAAMLVASTGLAAAICWIAVGVFGLPGQVWASGQPGWTPDLAVDDGRAMAAMACTRGMRAGFAFPIRVDDEVVGVLEFLSAHVRLLDAGMVATIGSVAAQIGDVLRRGDTRSRDRWSSPAHPIPSEADADAEARRLAFVGNARALLSSSFDYDSALELVPRLAASSLADWCLLEFVDSDGRVERVVIAQSGGDDSGDDASDDELARIFGARPPAAAGARAAVPGESLLVSHVDDAALAAAFPRQEQFQLIRRVRTRSMMRVPLRADGRVLAILTLLRTRNGASFQPADLAAAEELALMAAVAIDKARLRREAEEALRLHDNFLFVSHDLNHPLHVIDLNARLLGELLPGDGPQAEEVSRGLGRIRRASLRMSALIRELLDLAHLQVGEPIDLERTPTDLVGLARQAVEEFQRDATDRTIELEAAVPTLIGLFDRSRIERVISNLVGNAVRYNRPGGVVHVAVARDLAGASEAAPNGWAVIEVADTGIGIPRAFLPYLFRPFRRAANVVGLSAGAGLGLASAHQVVAHHGGTITVESTEGEGSVFTVRLPL